MADLHSLSSGSHGLPGLSSSNGFCATSRHVSPRCLHSRHSRIAAMHPLDSYLPAQHCILPLSYGPGTRSRTNQLQITQRGRGGVLNGKEGEGGSSFAPTWLASKETEHKPVYSSTDCRVCPCVSERSVHQWPLVVSRKTITRLTSASSRHASFRSACG